MNVSRLEVLTQRTALWSIDTYQKHISPKKGFACPHRLLYGGQSCSNYAKELLLHQDLSNAIGLTKKRFHDCTKASQKLDKSEISGGCIIIPCCFPL
ncbi:membrane protein insertion efficiency factor YidD [Chroococcus sp. FPU101]|uniref:membrane protein insertion efficiency factor YidD n=1 Tax=Chroococcus sp. FPU101 TaxID=1974212 RepID=UPI001A8D4D00|nr:membrane protein insertion efficiency factor YidD [Chroococcus sp. FPU101]